MSWVCVYVCVGACGCNFVHVRARVRVCVGVHVCVQAPMSVCARMMY